jgi:hypothetical protein
MRLTPPPTGNISGCARGFPLGLVLAGTAITTLADGTKSYKLTALGEVFVGDERQRGVILLDSGPSDVLIGMELLKAFNKSLFLHEVLVSLIDSSEIEETVANQTEQQTETPPTA